MNKAQLIKAVEQRLETGERSAKEAVDHVVDIIVRSVAKGERVAISGFGVFEKRRRGPRIARNPKTGAAVKVKATSVPAFRAGSPFKEVVSGAKKLDKVMRSTTRSANGLATKSNTPKKTVARSSTNKAETTTRAPKALAKKASPARAGAVKAGTKATTKAKAAAKTLPAKSSAKKSTGKPTAVKSVAVKPTRAKSTAAKKTVANRAR